MNLGGLISQIPNIVAVVGKSKAGQSLLPSILAKLGIKIDPDLIGPLFDFINQVKEEEGFSSIADVITSEKYSSEITSLISSFTEARAENESITLSREAVIECPKCGYIKTVSSIIDGLSTTK